MGFPVVGCCADLALPPFLVYIVLFLGYLRRGIAWCLAAVGLGDLLDDDFAGDLTSPSTSSTHALQYTAAGAAAAGVSGGIHLQHTVRPRPRSLSSTLIREALPTSTYEPCDDCESCAVCLYGLESGDQVRRLGGCRHVFHACCIDPWVDLGRRTCPLCRAPLLPEELRDSLHMSDDTAGGLWTDAASLPNSLLTDTASYPGQLYLADDGDYYPTRQNEIAGEDFLYSDLDDDLSLGLPPIEHSMDTGFLTWPTLQDTGAVTAGAT